MPFPLFPGALTTDWRRCRITAYTFYLKFQRDSDLLLLKAVGVVWGTCSFWLWDEARPKGSSVHGGVQSCLGSDVGLGRWHRGNTRSVFQLWNLTFFSLHCFIMERILFRCSVCFSSLTKKVELLWRAYRCVCIVMERIVKKAVLS